MANNDFVSGLVIKLLVSAASAAGSKIGGAAAAYVLDLLGLGGTDDLDDIKSELDTMSDQVKKTDSKVSILMDEVKWDKTTDSFDIACHMSTGSARARKAIGSSLRKPMRTARTARAISETRHFISRKLSWQLIRRDAPRVIASSGSSGAAPRRKLRRAPTQATRKVASR